MSLIRSNRDKAQITPKKSASISDLKDKEKPLKKNKQTKGYKTTLTIDSHTKNKLQALVLMGDAPTMKDGFSVAMQVYYDGLPEERKSMFDILYGSLESRDSKK